MEGEGVAANGWRTWVLGIAIVVLFASGITSAALIHLAKDTDGWDSRVLPLAEFVAHERGLEFDNPVRVEFLDDDAFNREVADDGGGELTETDEDEADRFARLFRAVGLVSGDVDLAGSSQQMVEEGLLALYNPDQERILVRGTDMNVSVRATLVHELTHALQDQHFDLTRIDEFETSGEELAFRALAEGDADRIENRYIDELSSSEQDEYHDESDQAPDLEGIPPALLAYFGAPYALGDGFVGVIDEIDGQSGVDDAFQDPPTTDENLIDPFTYLAGDGATSVESPELADLEEEFDRGDWGAMTWLLMLGARIDPHVALRATDGWGGDAYVAYERGGTTCVRIAYLGETPDDTAEMASALDQWVAAMPPGSASVQRTGDQLRVNACDPGVDTAAEFDPEEEQILILPAIRAELVREFLSQGAPEDAARCIAQRVVDSTSLEELSDPEALAENRDFQPRIAAIVQECR